MAFDARKYIDQRLSLNAILRRQKRYQAIAPPMPIAPPLPVAPTHSATVDLSKKVLAWLAKDCQRWRNVRSISLSVDVSSSWAYSLLARLETEGLVEKKTKHERGHQQKEFRITRKGLASIDAPCGDTV